MKRRTLVNLLADHADLLNRRDTDDLDVAAWLADYGPVRGMSSLLTLLQLAQAVKRALVPVEPSPLFQAELETRLARGEGEVMGKRPFSREVWLGAAAAGLVGILFLALRRVRFVSNRSHPATTAV